MSASDLNSSEGTNDSKRDDSLRSDSGVFDESCRSLPGQNRPSSPESVEHTLLQYAKTQYNISRKIIIKNIPPTTYNQVKNFLGSYSVKNILLSKRNRQAVVCLANGSQAEDLVQKLDQTEFMGQSVDVNLYRNENFLCVAHLPLNITDQDFKGLVTELGPTERCFLMRDSRGRSKGYGFVEYSHNYEKTKQACSLLNNKRMGSCTLHCEFIKDEILTFDDLNSSCLFVDHLPPNYNDTEEFTQIFSSMNKPVFCEIGKENGKSLGFGLVEYSQHVEAEEAFKRLHGKTIKHYTVRVTYCIPGLTAKEVYDRQIKSMITTTPRSGGLLPSPFQGALLSTPTDALANPVMKSLLSQSPKVLENFETILTDLHSHLSGKEQDASVTGDLNALSDPNLQVSILACILTTQLQENQPALFNNPIVQQFLKTNSAKSSEEKSEAEKLSLLGNPLLAQACRLLEDLCKNPPNKSTKESSTEQGGDTQNGSEGDAPERKVGLLGDGPGDSSGPTGSATPAKNTDVYAGLQEGINPLLALIIEAQIRQQLQGIQTLSILSSVSKMPLLGNAPDNTKDSQFMKTFSGKRKPLMGDAPPGHEEFNSKGGSGSGQQNPEMWAQWSQSNKQGGSSDSDGNWSQMCQFTQMCQQYMQQLNQPQQNEPPKGDPDDMGSGSASDAVYCSGIASQSAFSTNMGSSSNFPSFNFQQAPWFNPKQQQFKGPSSGQAPRFNPSKMGSSSRNSDSGYQNNPGSSKNAPAQNPFSQRQGPPETSNSRAGSGSSFGGGQGSGYNSNQMSSGNYHNSSQKPSYSSQSHHHQQQQQQQQQQGRQPPGSSHHSYNQSQGPGGSSSHHPQTSRQQQQQQQQPMGLSQNQQPLLQTPQQHSGGSSLSQRPSQYQQSQSHQPSAPPTQSLFNQNMYGTYSTKGPETYSTSTGRNSPPHPQNQDTYADTYNTSHVAYSNYGDNKFNPTVASTPVPPQQGVKRSHGLLPSPEPSPDGSYIGQHSQGLGGHYADSYLKKRRL